MLGCPYTTVAGGARICFQAGLETASVRSGTIGVGGHDINPSELRPGSERLADHHAGLGPVVGLLDALDPCDNRAWAGEYLVGKVEFVRYVPDIRAGGGHRINANRALCEATN